MPEETPDTPDPTEALRQQLATANARLIQSELKSHAVRAGLIDLDCLKLLDTSKLKLNDDGAITDGETTLATMKLAKPWLFAKSALAQNTSSASPAPKPESATTFNAMKMSHEEWQAARAQMIKGK